MDFISMCSRIESEIKDLKSHINSLESERISCMLQSLKEDGVRLSNCIDEIQIFHRDMFVLRSTEEKLANTKKGILKNDNTKSKYYVTEPKCFGNKPSNSVSKSEPSLPRLIMKIPKCIMNKYSSENDSDDELYEMEEESYDTVDELSNIKYESNGVKDVSYGSKSESNSSKSSSSKSESEDNKDESSDEENKEAKKLLLDLLADREEGITNLLLHLISRFASFQRDLRTVETKGSELGEIYSGGSNVTIKNLLNTLSGSVLHLDKTVSTIYAKYFEILESFKKG